MKRKVIPNNEIHNVKLILLIPFDFSPNYPGKTIPIVGRAIAQNRSKKREGEKNGGFLLFRSIPSIDSPARPLITEGESSAVTIIRGSLSANWRARRFRGGCTFFELESRLIAPSLTREHVCVGVGGAFVTGVSIGVFSPPTSLKLTNRSPLRFLRLLSPRGDDFRRVLLERNSLIEIERENFVFLINYPL